jgi:iron complex outermembrane receptor protein
LRYTSDRQHVTGGNYGVAGLIPSSVTVQNAPSNKLTWRFTLDHQFTPQLMGYASYNRGYKSGVFNGTSPQDPAVKPSVIDAYEAGAKSQWLDSRLRLNGSVFYYNYDQVQLSVSQRGMTKLLNAAQATIKGMDLDAEIIPLKRLTLSGGLSYVDAHYTDFPIAPIATVLPTGGYTVAPGDGSGNSMVYTPKWTITASALYSIPAATGTYSLAVNYYYNGRYFPDPANQFPQSPYYLLNTSVDWTSSDDRWKISLWGKNLNDAQYYSNINPTALRAAASAAAPRTFGATFSVKWGGP